MSAVQPLLGHEERYFVEAPMLRVMGRVTLRSGFCFKKCEPGEASELESSCPDSCGSHSETHVM
jgi:hypothetical protein